MIFHKAHIFYTVNFLFEYAYKVVMILAKEVLEEIRKAEIAAEDLISKSQVSSKEVLKSAQLKSKEKLDEASNMSQKIISDMIRQSEAEAKKTAEQILKEARRECEVIENIPEDKADKAINLIIERIVKPYGDS